MPTITFNTKWHIEQSEKHQKARIFNETVTDINSKLPPTH